MVTGHSHTSMYYYYHVHTCEILSLLFSLSLSHTFSLLLSLYSLFPSPHPSISYHIEYPLSHSTDRQSIELLCFTDGWSLFHSNRGEPSHLHGNMHLWGRQQIHTWVRKQKQYDTTMNIVNWIYFFYSMLEPDRGLALSPGPHNNNTHETLKSWDINLAKKSDF